MKTPDWMPIAPVSFQKHLAHFSPHRDGFVRKHAGKTLFVLSCGRFLKELDELGWMSAIDLLSSTWDSKREKAEAAATDSLVQHRSKTGISVHELVSEFFIHLD